MANPGYTSRAVLSWKAGLTAMPSLASRYLGLLTTAPSDSDSGSVEVSAGTYARLQIAGAITAGASWTTSSSSITMGSSNPGWVVAGMSVYDLTAGAAIGTVSSYSGSTLTLTGNASHASSGSTDSLAFSAFPAATGQGPASLSTGAALSFASSGASAWGTVVAGALFDASTAGNMLDWDWLGNDPWFPFDCSDASPGVLTAYGITAGSSPTLANGASVALTARFGGTLPTGLSAETIYTVAGLSADTFNVGTNTTSTGAGMVRQLTQQSVPINTTFTIPAGDYSIYLA